MKFFQEFYIWTFHRINDFLIYQAISLVLLFLSTHLERFCFKTRAPLCRKSVTVRYPVEISVCVLNNFLVQCRRNIWLKSGINVLCKYSGRMLLSNFNIKILTNSSISHNTSSPTDLLRLLRMIFLHSMYSS